MATRSKNRASKNGQELHARTGTDAMRSVLTLASSEPAEFIAGLDNAPELLSWAYMLWLREAEARVNDAPPELTWREPELSCQNVFSMLTRMMIIYGDHLGINAGSCWTLFCETTDDPRCAGYNQARKVAEPTALRTLQLAEGELMRLRAAAYLQAGRTEPDIGLKKETHRQIIAVITAAGHRLTTDGVIEALAKKLKGAAASDGIIKSDLAELVRNEKLNNDQRAKPRGYGLPGW